MISAEIVAAIIGSSIGGAVLIAIAVLKWLDKRISKIEENVAAKQNGNIQVFMDKQDKRHRAICRRQNKLEKVVYAFIGEIKNEWGARVVGKLKTRAEDAIK